MAMARRRRKRRSRRVQPRWIGLAAVGVALFVAGFFFGSHQPRLPWPVGPKTEPPVAPAEVQREPSDAVTTRQTLPEPTSLPEDGARKGMGEARVAVVIDDLGRGLEELDELAQLKVPLTYSVLPFELRTAEVVAELRRRGVEILCHLPMEAGNGANPGPGALTRSMPPRQLEAATRAALAAVPGAVGVNNHMGSLFSADPSAMKTTLGVLAEEALFFLDSRTSADSVAYRLALDLGIPACERQVFLDGDPQPQAIRNQFRRLLEIASRRGAAVAIGHPNAATVATLRTEVPRARSLGYEFVPVSYLLDRPESLPQ